MLGQAINKEITFPQIDADTVGAAAHVNPKDSWKTAFNLQAV